MKIKNPELVNRYLVALRAHLGSRRPSGLETARLLGGEIMAAGYVTLDLARLHELALVTLARDHNLTNTRNGLIRRAANFLTSALIPLERAHRATRASLAQARQRAATLRGHTAALAEGNRQLRREVRRRKAGEAAVSKGKVHYQRLFLQSQIMQKKLRHLARQILAAQENERREISRELHDEVVQTLVGINVELAALSRSAALGIRALRAKITRTQLLVEKSVNAVHQFARELRPAVLDDLGLIPALEAYLKIVTARHHFKIRLIACAGVEKMTAARRTVLYRVAQEALTNIARHARAGRVEMSIAAFPGGMRMTIHDDGKSFDVAAVLSAGANRRLGLLGMRERVEMMGGRLDIDSAPGRGTTVVADLPFGPGGES